MRLIRESAHRPLSSGEVVNAMAVSRRLLERRFRRALNRGIAEEIRRVHVERAKALLLSTELSVADVATAAGFSEAKHLAVAFRRSSGMTATAYRRQVRGPARTAGWDPDALALRP